MRRGELPIPSMLPMLPLPLLRCRQARGFSRSSHHVATRLHAKLQEVTPRPERVEIEISLL
jgi:hypothetical protein